jgi:hypothetical protein
MLPRFVKKFVKTRVMADPPLIIKRSTRRSRADFTGASLL